MLIAKLYLYHSADSRQHWSNAIKPFRFRFLHLLPHACHVRDRRTSLQPKDRNGSPHAEFHETEPSEQMCLSQLCPDIHEFRLYLARIGSGGHPGESVPDSFLFGFGALLYSRQDKYNATWLVFREENQS